MRVPAGGRGSPARTAMGGSGRRLLARGPCARGKTQLRNQGQMVGGDARQLRIGDFDADHLKPRADKDVVDARGRKAAGKGAFGAVIWRRGLYILESLTESATHRR